MRRRALALSLGLALVACKRNPPPPPPPPPAVDASAMADAAPPNAPTDAGAPPVAIVRIRNISAVPITIMTNPDVNEMLHTWRLNVSADRSDRGLIYLNDPAQLTRVKLFPVDLPPCDSDAAVGFGGLGQTGTVVLAPGEVRDLGAWDGRQREEVIDPVRGGCLREYPAAPGRYRFHFDNPHNLKPECQRVVFRVPIEGDGGVPVIEIRCMPHPDGATGDEE